MSPIRPNPAGIRHYPPDDAPAAGGGLPSVTSWRQWGHSWASGGFDDQQGPEPNRTRITERIAGIMHLPPHAVVNEAVFGSQAMSSGADGFGRVLQKCKPHSTYQHWPWEPHRFAVEAFLWGVNDIGGQHNTGNLWAGQGTMWNYVWANTWRSIISRCIAGGIFGSTSIAGLAPPVWRKNASGVMVADFSFVPKGPGGVGAGSWVFKQDTASSTGYGYWYTTANGDVMDLTIPVDYYDDTIAIRHLCPGSWFNGPVVFTNPVTGGTGGTEQPQTNILTGAENPRAASAVTVIGGNVSATVNCRGLADRVAWAGTGSNPGAGVIGGHGAMTHVSRHALTPTPGGTQTVRITVNGLPAGGWYGFDSWEIPSAIEVRPIVIVANVADPANWGVLYSFYPQNAWDMATARAQDFSDVINTICSEFVDPGIMVADIRNKIATHPKEYAELLDNNVTAGNLIGDVVELSAYSTVKPSGDGTHPHAVGERLIIEAHMDALSTANLPRGRGAIPFAPSRSLQYARSTGE